MLRTVGHIRTLSRNYYNGTGLIRNLCIGVYSLNNSGTVINGIIISVMAVRFSCNRAWTRECRQTCFILARLLTLLAIGWGGCS